MLDIGWTEILVIAIVAIVVIGPKELPRALRTLGQWIGKARAMTRDLQNSVNDMISESELDELRKAGNSIGDFGSNDMLNKDFGTDFSKAHSSLDKTPELNNNPTPPPPTPLKWPPDEVGDVVGDEANDGAENKSLDATDMMPEIMPDITSEDDGVPIPSPDKSDGSTVAKSTDS